MKTGKIVAYQPDGTAEIKGMQLNRFLVTFADGQQWKFLAKGEFKKKIGEEVQYEIKNETSRNASFIYEQRQNFNTNSNRTATSNSTNDSIMFQVCYKANMEVFGAQYRDQVHKFTEEDFEWMSNYLKNRNG